MSLQVLLNKPNIIGYTRLLLLFSSIFCDKYFFICFYIFSVSLDYFDGMIARKYNQTSILGACLDMITDRISTTILCTKISISKPHYSIYYMLFIFFDILGHMLYFISSNYSRLSHKQLTKNFFFRVYYNEYVMKILCFGTEAYFLLVYYETKENLLFQSLAILPIIKTFFHIIHLYIGLVMLSDVV